MKNFFTCTCLVVGLLLINHFFVNRFKTHLASRSDLAIVDQSLQNYQKLLEDLPKDVEVILASESGNGLADLQVKLSKYAGVKRLHLLTHGTDGEVILAGVHLSERNMSQYKSFWQTLRSSITKDGQLLIYSCDLASGKKGQDFVRHLSAELAISVAASKDPTGAASKGGNWNLEYVSGLVDGSSTLTPVGYDGLLIPQFTALSGDSSPLKNFVASAQTQLIYGDFDKDGDVDIHSYPGSGANNRFWQNQGNGTFTDVTDLNSNPFRNLPNKAAFSSREYTFVADFDNDGDIDVLATKRGDDKNVFFRNDNGVFVERKGGDSPFSLVSIFQDTQIIYGDFDKDGDIDLDTWDGKSASNDYWQNNGSGVFTKLTNNTQNPFRNLGYRGGFYASATYARVEDWDNDGDDDIYLVIYDTGDNNVLLRNNNGVFTKESGTASPFKDIPQRAGQNNQFIYGDFDADGDLDIQATANNSSFFYYRNNGSGTFTNVSGGNNPFDLLTYKSPFYSTAPKAFVADWDNDGDDDVFTTQWDANNANVLFIQGGAPVKIISTSPVRNSTSASVKANIVLNFNNELNVVAGKDIVIKRANNTTFATIPVSSAQVTGGGSSAITINPTADLDGLTTFYVLIDKGAFVDTDGRPFQGFSTSTDFVFTSAAAPSAPTVTTAAASTIGNTTAALGGNVTADGGASVTDRGIVWGTVSGPSISNNKVQNTSGTGSFNAVVSDLPEGTRVYVRAYATNEIGTSYGSEIDFYTKTRVVSILPVSTSPTNANTLSYNVVFAQSVSGVSSNDFSVVTTGSTTASVAGVTGSGTDYAVSITVSGGNGTLRLDLTDPSGTTPNVNQNFTTATSYVIYRVTEATNHFRKLNSSGNWNMAATWESSADFANWIPATLAPTSTASSISMASGSTVTVPQGINASSPTLLNDGVLIVNGVLSVSGSVTSGGTLAGSGTIASSGITSNGIISPGNSPGILSFNGSAVSNGVVNIQLTGSIPGTGYDQLLVSGALSLGGTLNVSLGADYIPAVNDEFTIIDAGSIAGSFATINLPSVSPRVWTTTYNNTNGTLILKVVNDPLPVTLTSFDARKSETITLLSWQTSAEINSSHFEIQRNIKNLGWKKIAHVVASGQSGSLRSYNYTDAKPNSGENLYRLKLVDADAAFTYSKIVSVHFETTRLSVYPNPVSDKILILDSHIIKNFKLYDTKGVLLESGTSFPGSGLDVRHYVSGMYIINITDEDGKSNNFKFVKN